MFENGSWGRRVTKQELNTLHVIRFFVQHFKMNHCLRLGSIRESLPFFIHCTEKWVRGRSPTSKTLPHFKTLQKIWKNLLISSPFPRQKVNLVTTIPERYRVATGIYATGVVNPSGTNRRRTLGTVTFDDFQAMKLVCVQNQTKLERNETKLQTWLTKVDAWRRQNINHLK